MENKSVKKSLEKSKIVLEEKGENGQAKKLHKKDQQVYNKWYELRWRAINNTNVFRRSLRDIFSFEIFQNFSRI